jgi:site-specific DNA-methyltransferase (adenine-specific)
MLEINSIEDLKARGQVLVNSVINADCFEAMPFIKDKSIDLILTDMPYNTTACEWDVKIPLDKLWIELKRIGKDNAAYVFTASQPFTTDLINSNRKWFKYEWIWEKEQGTNQNLCNIRPLKQHENILLFCNNKELYNPQFSKGIKYIVKRNNKTENDPIIGTPQQKIDTINNGNYYPTTIIKFNREIYNRVHPTQKPVALFEYLIKTYSNENDTILDCFAGSGTTAIACLNTKRNYILIEKEHTYIEVINKRITEHKLLIENTPNYFIKKSIKDTNKTLNKSSNKSKINAYVKYLKDKENK